MTPFHNLPTDELEMEAAGHMRQMIEVPDFGLGNFTLLNSSSNFKLRCGVEAKRAMNIMTSLPPASSIMHIQDVEPLFHILSFQAENQARAAYKNGYPLSDNGGIQWILLVGPY